MLKRLFLILLVLASVGVIIFTLWQTDVEETQQETLLHFVPNDALLILDVEDAQGFHAKLKDGSVLWPDLQRIEWASHLDGIATDIDSLLAPLYAQHPDSSINYVLSLHPSGQENYRWMLTLSLGDIASIKNLIGRAKGYLPSKERSYNGISIYTLSGDDDKLYATLQEDILHLSNSNLVIERSIRSEFAMMMTDKKFQKSHATIGKHNLAHLHIQWSEFPNVLQTLLPTATDGQLKEKFAGWATSDILTDANSIYMHGLVQASDSSGHHLAAYRQQGEGSYTDFLELCPASTASFSYQHISRSALWLSDDESKSDSLITMLGIGFFQAELESTGLLDDRGFYIIPIKEVSEAEAWLREHSTSTTEILGQKVYTGVAIHSLEQTYGPLGQDMIACLFDEHLILSASSSSIKDIILSQKTGRTLTNDEHFMQLNDDMDDEVALCYYFNVARCQGMIERLASEELNASLAIDPTSLGQFQALVVQYSPASDGLFHQNVLLRHNPIYKKETSSLWEFEMDTLFQMGVHVLKNHYTDQFELLIQDARQDIHLIDNTGRELWSLALDEPIRSDVTQVDLYKNGKLQMAFNTDTRFYILDRNGKALDGFPVVLSDSASSRLSVMDYDNKRKYRFLIGTEDGMLHNYDKNGKAVKGWKYKATDEPIIGDLHHFLVGRKDYVSAIGADGSLRFLERSGKVRHSAPDKPLSDYDGGAYRIITAKKIGACSLIYTDQDGRLISSQVDGPFKVMEDRVSTNLSSSTDYLIHEDDLTLRYNSKSEERMRAEHELSSENSYAQLLTADHIGIADQNTGLYYIYGVEGALIEGFPLPGQHALVKDMNSDGILDVILWGAKNVSMYGLSGR